MDGSDEDLEMCNNDVVAADKCLDKFDCGDSSTCLDWSKVRNYELIFKCTNHPIVFTIYK